MAFVWVKTTSFKKQVETFMIIVAIENVYALRGYRFVKRWLNALSELSTSRAYIMEVSACILQQITVAMCCGIPLVRGVHKVGSIPTLDTATVYQ
jgi:hypothetical protein